MHRRQLPIVSPCHEDWNDMTGAGAARHCESCDESVQDLSAMSSDDARAFLREHGEQQPCVRYRFDRAGRLLFAAALGMAASGCLMGKMPSECESPPPDPVASPVEGPVGMNAEDEAGGEAQGSEVIEAPEPGAGTEPDTDPQNPG
ncbi:hypothetical protein DB30_01287 [Enhygromyxa salina]|uniref:Uncharacterized protein n=1 Tax=Enhygromyxa salina TaxID=215803 RepID=A0A0C2CS97_9BACT|nr:hypothetical protein [Enhygromyxa salina]KIG12525.1 hypothetical protein DB30_01287 [Enhygromyxa salina]